MHLVQLLLPLYDNAGKPFANVLFGAVRAELTKRFGGLTAYQRAPAEGLYDDARGHVVRDDVVIFEVMCEELDERYWASYRAELTTAFSQDELVVRALAMQRL
ncbi:MAG TPA: hypothetical protein VFG30_15010 [Polyangiales bacterium]|nr:hypothetical protein [Polyangiales bacterium]